MIKKKSQEKIELDFVDPYLKYPLKFKIIPVENLEVISYQRKPSLYHIKHLSNSIERIGFIVPIIVVENNNLYTIIDGQHRFLASKELGIRELPAIVVPSRLVRLIMNLNIEKELNIREKSQVAFAVFNEYLNTNPEIFESDPEIVDSIEQAYYLTLGIVYAKQEKFAGSSFESILKKCDFFLDEQLKIALAIREKRAELIIEVDMLIKEISKKLKELGKWHPYIYQQIISYANPYKRKRSAIDFDEFFAEMINNLKEILNKPEKILKESIIEINF